MEAALCKNCKRFGHYSFSEFYPLVICHWGTDKERPWSREKNETAIAVRTGKEMSRKELKEWTKKPYGELRYIRNCSCYEPVERVIAEFKPVGAEVRQLSILEGSGNS